MRKYIILALTALVALTSCKLDDGSEPQPNRVNRVLWAEVSNNIYQVNIYAKYFICADVILYGDQESQNIVKNLWFDDFEIIVDANNVSFARFRDSQKTEEYIVKTDGKKLSEAGKWSVVYNNYLSTNDYTMATVNGVIGENNIYVHNISETRYKESRDIVATVGYSMLKEKNSIEILFNCRGEIKDEDNSYLLSFSTDAISPLSVSPDLRSYLSGKVKIEYKDNISGKRKAVTVFVSNSKTEFIEGL